MKKNYTSPFAEILLFETEEILGPSQSGSTGGDDSIVDSNGKENVEAGDGIDVLS